MALLIYLKIILLQYFQFSVISSIQIDLKSQPISIKNEKSKKNKGKKVKKIK